MTTDTVTRNYAETEALLRDPIRPHFGTTADGRFTASCNYPADEVVRGVHCFGVGKTLGEAVAEMRENLDKAINARKKLRTAKECKEAVLGLIREHAAAPAAFRDAVDELDVA